MVQQPSTGILVVFVSQASREPSQTSAVVCCYIRIVRLSHDSAQSFLTLIHGFATNFLFQGLGLGFAMGRRSVRLTRATEAEEGSPTKASKRDLGKETPGSTKEKKKKKHKKNKENRLKSDDGASKTGPFVRKRDDGSTSLAIITPGDGVLPGSDKPVTLGAILGRVRAGTASLATFREDRRNVAKPMLPIYYGGYSSHGPTHDSTFANLTQSESSLVGHYYDKRSLENEELIRSVCGVDYSSTFVDHLLDLFGGKEVTDYVMKDTTKIIEKKKGFGPESEVDFDLLKTLEQDGIDVSFMSTLQAAYELRQEQEMKDLSLEEQLELTAHLIDSLASAQSSRLSAPPPPSLSNIAQPGDQESKIAERVVLNLKSMSEQAKPSEVVDLVQVRKAMGVAAPPPPPVVDPVVEGEVQVQQPQRDAAEEPLPAVEEQIGEVKPLTNGDHTMSVVQPMEVA